jgi:hypothetical protein
MTDNESCARAGASLANALNEFIEIEQSQIPQYYKLKEVRQAADKVLRHYNYVEDCFSESFNKYVQQEIKELKEVKTRSIAGKNLLNKLLVVV